MERHHLELGNQEASACVRQMLRCRIGYIEWRIQPALGVVTPVECAEFDRARTRRDYHRTHNHYAENPGEDRRVRKEIAHGEIAGRHDYKDQTEM